MAKREPKLGDILLKFVDDSLWWHVFYGGTWHRLAPDDDWFNHLGDGRNYIETMVRTIIREAREGQMMPDKSDPRCPFCKDLLCSICGHPWEIDSVAKHCPSCSTSSVFGFYREIVDRRVADAVREERAWITRLIERTVVHPAWRKIIRIIRARNQDVKCDAEETETIHCTDDPRHGQGQVPIAICGKHCLFNWAEE